MGETEPDCSLAWSGSCESLHAAQDLPRSCAYLMRILGLMPAIEEVCHVPTRANYSTARIPSARIYPTDLAESHGLVGRNIIGPWSSHSDKRLTSDGAGRVAPV